jgi:hypothetical protein
MNRILPRAIAIWILLAAVAAANGITRVAWITPHLGEKRAHIVSTLVLCILIFVVSLIFIRWIGPRSPIEASMVGLMWIVLTLTFEFLAGHYVFGHSWRKLLADYSILQGRIWILVPIVTCVAPWCAFRLRGQDRSRKRTLCQ